MTDENESIINAFISYEKERGIKKNAKDFKAQLKPFFSYLKNQGLSLTDVRVKEAQDFQTYLSTLEKEDGTLHYASLTVRGIVSLALALYNYLRSAGRVYANPFLGIKRLKLERKLPRNIPPEEKMNEFLEYLGRFWEHENVRDQRIYYKVHVISELMYATGMRISEVLALGEKEIDFESKVIFIKNSKGRSRKAYLNDYATQLLKLYLKEMRAVVNVRKENEQVFGVGKKCSLIQTLNKFLKLAGHAKGIGDYVSHNFRHTLGFHLLKRGCDMRYIQLILGHEDMNTTTIYTKVEKSDLRRELDRYHPRKLKGERE